MGAYIISACRSAVGKAKKGVFRNKRPDDLGTEVIKYLLEQTPDLDKALIDDVIVGNAMPEAEQGLNMGRMISLMGLDSVKIPGMTINRYCASGLEAIAIAAAKINAGMAHCIVAGGVESMSYIPMGGWRLVPNPHIAQKNPDWYWNMGITAEAVADKYNISREAQDEFSFHSHKKAVQAIESGLFKSQIAPVQTLITHVIDHQKRVEQTAQITTDEGPRQDTSLEKLAQLKPVFAKQGSVTAGNSSQTSDGAAFTLVVSETFLNKHKLTPLARFVNYAVVGVEPKYMGIGPIDAVPLALAKSGLKLNAIDQIELNEAFAAQSLAVINELQLNPNKVNVNGGAIALGHPLGCTGAKLSVQLIHDLKRKKHKYGMVTMCVGSGQGAAGIFESI